MGDETGALPRPCQTLSSVGPGWRPGPGLLPRAWPRRKLASLGHGAFREAAVAWRRASEAQGDQGRVRRALGLTQGPAALTVAPAWPSTLICPLEPATLTLSPPALPRSSLSSRSSGELSPPPSLGWQCPSDSTQGVPVARLPSRPPLPHSFPVASCLWLSLCDSHPTSGRPGLAFPFHHLSIGIQPAYKAALLSGSLLGLSRPSVVVSLEPGALSPEYTGLLHPRPSSASPHCGLLERKDKLCQ